MGGHALPNSQDMVFVKDYGHTMAKLLNSVRPKVKVKSQFQINIRDMDTYKCLAFCRDNGLKNMDNRLYLQYQNWC